MTRLGLALALAFTLAACGEDVPGTTPGASPTPRPSSGVTVQNLSGRWVFGTGAEPTAGAVIGCTAPQILNLSDQNGKLSGGVSICGGPCKLVETFAGTNAQGLVQLKGEFQGNFDPVTEDVTYTLSFNPETQHLVGTRSGKPFWAAPLVEPSKQECAQLAL